MDRDFSAPILKETSGGRFIGRVDSSMTLRSPLRIHMASKMALHFKIAFSGQFDQGEVSAGLVGKSGVSVILQLQENICTRL